MMMMMMMMMMDDTTCTRDSQSVYLTCEDMDNSQETSSRDEITYGLRCVISTHNDDMLLIVDDYDLTWLSMPLLDRRMMMIV